MPDRHLGRTLGRFRIDSVVGSGGFAWVYKGYDPELDIPIAVKVLKPHFAGDETFESRFRREASVAAKLRHPNIVRILAVGREAEAVYFVMDYLPHGLVDRLRVMGTIPEALLLRTGIDVANALAFAHREGVIHRDIKADNILFDGHGNAIVADFGIARAVSGYVKQTGTNMVVGTPQYFSPEQARGLHLDGRADLYSLGITLFRCATGTLPYDGDDWYEIARQHVEDEPPSPRSLNPAISAEMDRIILKCIAKEPDHRFATAEALQEALFRLSSGQTDTTGERTLEMPRVASRAPLRAVQPVAVRSARRRIAAIGASIVFLAVSALALMSSRSGKEAPAAKENADSVPTAVLPAISPESTVAPRPILRVNIPAEAMLAIDGKNVGRGQWESDTMPAGSHVISAWVASNPQCPTSRESRSIAMASSGLTTVTLKPRACGHLVIDGKHDGANYTVTERGGPTRKSGTVDGQIRLVLPVGRYDLRMSAPACADYENASIRIEAGKTMTTTPILLICG
ncbi:MAG: serine/threonine protein kinase [Anaerolineae bacterium]|nr:serine/threonine protein kinase [Gemmatimonadaceae bacterium]